VQLTRNLSRLLKPRRIAVIGGGAWCASIIRAAERIDYAGEILPVHPDGKEIAGRKAIRRLQDWPGLIDAAFVGINRRGTISVIETLAEMNAGGAVCFASGFTEATAEDAEASDLQARLVQAAGDMPILGPNCYGYINALDRCAIWPDQHGMEPVERGVAILTQSSNIAINMTMQQRLLPIAFMITCGNMAQTSQAQIAKGLLDDPRISAIGVHIEGFGNLRDWESLAARASQLGVPIVALKTGKSDQARNAAISHTASLTGSDTGAQAFLNRLGIARLKSVPDFLEALKLLHCVGPLDSNRIAAISCSGGEASLIADMGTDHALDFPSLCEVQERELRTVLGPMVSLANPLDYHTYIWRDAEKMGKAWAAMARNDVSMTLSIVDYPHTDATDWGCATEAAITARSESGKPFAVASSLPELMPPPTARHLLAQGVVPLCGLDEALSAIEAATRVGPPNPDPVLLPGTILADSTLSEAEAKLALAEHGLEVPAFHIITDAREFTVVARQLSPPFALKGQGLAHKSDHGAVRLGLSTDQLEKAAQTMGTGTWLVEEMVTDGVAELLIGVTRDGAHGFVLTLGAGGVLTELLQDTVSLLVPARSEQVEQALKRLRVYPLLAGYRGKPPANMEALLRAVMAIQDYVVANANSVGEVEINPLICTPNRAVAVDALIRKEGT
jgi:acyl-CoA synthetase (NDP forming)